MTPLPHRQGEGSSSRNLPLSLPCDFMERKLGIQDRILEEENHFPGNNAKNRPIMDENSLRSKVVMSTY